ncbi:class I SAM-dependent methyltransferase [Exiguobacterium acetylicum]|uniref:class I SAM-dependent methyltransferase n=1 Tax=Exiguobacterium sp. BMC-KP TaxID=1684312 RepID=UPI0006AA2C61|nr:methyltransferase domain-containing protein [Exiguobacterium sp. BMC-KP]KOP28549.1 methyltransferase type 11 [Exiguobacterium sp. BMC-KP]
MMASIKTARPKDEIRAAYYDQLGGAFGKRVRARVHWVVRQAKGENILDIGCSGGIVPILLGREGKHVVGIDVLPEAIIEAKQALLEEPASVQEKIEFNEANIMAFASDIQFDTVLMTEVLEHIGEPERFIARAVSFIAPEGRLVITVPFGVNDYADHKRTYYLNRLLEQLTPFGKVETVERIDKWLGITIQVYREQKSGRSIQPSEVDWLEKAFEEVERLHLATIIDLKRKQQHQEQKVRSLEEQTNQLEDVQAELLLREQQLQNQLEQYKVLEEQYTVLLDRFEGSLVSNLELLEANASWKLKYRSLARSKLGKLVVRYWKFRGQLKQRRSRR